MTDPPGLPAGLAIEAVQWLAEGGENLTVRITGRWRRRPTSSTGQPLLVIEDSEGHKHRFPAMPEPPSLTGAAPGTWRMSFSVPASLAPPVIARAWLQLGAAAIPLPQEEGPAPATGAADPETLAQRRLRSSELAVQAARRRAAEAEDAAADLAAQIERLEHELDQLQAQLIERQRDSRTNQQRAHAERMLREELQEELAERTHQQDRVDAAFEQLAAAEARVRELEAEIGQLRRRVDEAEHLAAAAQSARLRAECRLDEVTAGAGVAEPGREVAEPGAARDEPRPGPDPGVATVLRAELAVAARTLRPEHAAPVSAELPPAPAALHVEREMTTRLREAQARVAAEPPAPHPEPEQPAQRPAADHPAPERVPAEPAAPAPATAEPKNPLSSVLAALREELNQLREIAEGERAARVEAEQYASALERQLEEYATRCARAYAVIEELRDQLEDLREAYASLRTGTMGTTGEREGGAAGPVASERLQAALSRLREAATAEAPEAPEAPGSGERPGAVEAPGPGEPGPLIEREPEPESEAPQPPAPAPQPPAEPSPPPTDTPPAAGGESPPGAPAAATSPWLMSVMRSLLIADPAAAGRLVLALLPAQRLVYPRAVSFDLVIPGLGCVRVNGAAGPDEPTSVEITDAPRGPAEVEFQLTADLPSLARLVVSGRLRRRLGRKVAQLTGDRRSLRALMELIRTPLSLTELDAAGVRIEPMLALTIVSLMIDPSWTRGERFTIAYQPPGGGGGGGYLSVRDARPITVSEASPAGGAGTTIIAPPGSLLAVLSGADRPATVIEGDRRPMMLLRSWLNRAQSG